MPEAHATAGMIRLSRPGAYAALLLGGIGALVAASRTWWLVITTDARAGLDGNAVTGSLGQALGVVVLAGLGVSLTVGTLGRRIVAGLLAATGAGIAVLGLTHPVPDDAAVLGRLREVSLETSWTLQPTGWPGAFAGAGLLVAVGGIVMVLTAGHWRDRSGRFRTAADRADIDPEDTIAVWKAMDSGVDPTDESAVASRTDHDRTPDRKSRG